MPASHRDPLDTAPRTTMPTVPEPMLATLTEERFSDKNWIFEKKWDGVRCLAFRDAKGAVGLRSRNDLVLDDRYPEVVDAVRSQLATSAVLDGEVVAFRGNAQQLRGAAAAWQRHQSLLLRVRRALPRRP